MVKPYDEYCGAYLERDDGVSVPFVLPPARGDSPYFCADCGQATSFMMYGVTLPVNAYTENGDVHFNIPEYDIQKNVDMLTKHPSFLSHIDTDADRELKLGVGSRSHDGMSISPDAGLICIVCGGDDVRNKMEQLFKCEIDHCEGCFLCGIEHDYDSILEKCVECVTGQYLDYNSREDRTPILHQLDLDLTCDGCSLYHKRLEHGVDNETIKMKAY